MPVEGDRVKYALSCIKEERNVTVKCLMQHISNICHLSRRFKKTKQKNINKQEHMVSICKPLFQLPGHSRLLLSLVVESLLFNKWPYTYLIHLCKHLTATFLLGLLNILSLSIRSTLGRKGKGIPCHFQIIRSPAAQDACPMLDWQSDTISVHTAHNKAFWFFSLLFHQKRRIMINVTSFPVDLWT